MVNNRAHYFRRPQGVIALLFLLQLWPVRGEVSDDSLTVPGTATVNPDSVQSIVGSAQIDSTDISQKSDSTVSDIEGPIRYRARVIDNLIEDKITVLRGKAHIEYQNMSITAEKITVDWNAREMVAEGMPDMVWVENENGDSVQTEKMIGLPEFTEDGDVMVGERMKYNMKTRRAFVLRGRTEYDDGYYNGGAMKLYGKNQIFVGDAAFTTCDKTENTDYHFWSKEMKIIVNDKVIARPVVMYIGKIPVMALPFALFPIKKGRHSGIIIPRFGESSTEGRSLRGLGYYWAPSQYWDARATLNYYEKSGFLYRGDINYNKRYVLDGKISGSVTRKDFKANNQKQRRWDLRVAHNQVISPSTQFNINANLVSSDNIYRDLSANRNQRIQGQLNSNATLTHRLGGSGNLSINLNQTRNLQPGSAFHIQETLPQISFTNRWSNLIPDSKKGHESWFQQLTVPYSVQFSGKHQRTTYRDSSFSKIREGLGINHRLNLFVSPRLFGWMSLRPQVNYTEVWLDRRKGYSLNPVTNKIEARDERGFFAVRTFNSSISANTKIYGLFQSKYLPDVQIRHVITPTVSFSYQPDFTDKRWNYIVRIADTTGTIYEKNPYVNDVVSASIGTEQRAMNFSINNVFQMKRGQGEEARKMDLFSYNLSSGYNWKAKTHRFSDLRAALRANFIRNYNLTLSTVHSFYSADSLGQASNQLLADEVQWSDWHSLRKLRVLRITNLSLNLTFSLKGKESGRSREKSEHATQLTAPDSIPEYEEPAGLFAPGAAEDRYEPEVTFSGFNIPWTLRTTLTYSNDFRNTTYSKKFYSNLNLDFNLTENWKVSWRTRIDLNQKKFISQDFVFHRDLHCWEAYMTWTPTGPYKQFYLRINIKSSMLQDIKVEKGRGRRGYF